MKLSVNPKDRGHQDYKALIDAGANIDFFVDGEPVRDVIEADDLSGYIMCNARDKLGVLKTDGENFVEEMVRGKVEIRISMPKPEPEDVDVDGK